MSATIRRNPILTMEQAKMYRPSERAGWDGTLEALRRMMKFVEGTNKKMLEVASKKYGVKLSLWQGIQVSRIKKFTDKKPSRRWSPFPRRNKPCLLYEGGGYIPAVLGPHHRRGRHQLNS